MKALEGLLFRGATLTEYDDLALGAGTVGRLEPNGVARRSLSGAARAQSRPLSLHALVRAALRATLQKASFSSTTRATPTLRTRGRSRPQNSPLSSRSTSRSREPQCV